MPPIRSLILVVSASLALRPAVAAPAAGPRPWQSFADCADSDLLKKHPLPAGFPRDAAVGEILGRTLVRSPAEHEVACNVIAKQWKAQKEPTFVVALDTVRFRPAPSGGAERGQHQYQVGLYRQEPGGGYRLLAKTTEPVDLDYDERLDALDLAAYRLTPTELAFGVRVSRNIMVAGGVGTNVTLNLYRVSDNDLTPILSTLMLSTLMAPGLVDSNQGDEVPAEISVLPTRTGGHFDWKKRQGKRSVVLRWTGEGYELRGKDPVPDVN